MIKLFVTIIISEPIPTTKVPNDDKSNSNPNQEASKSARSGFSASAVAGLVMSVLIGGAIIFAAAVIIYRKYCRRSQNYDEVEMVEQWPDM